MFSKFGLYCKGCCSDLIMSKLSLCKDGLCGSLKLVIENGLSVDFCRIERCLVANVFLLEVEIRSQRIQHDPLYIVRIHR